MSDVRTIKVRLTGADAQGLWTIAFDLTVSTEMVFGVRKKFIIGGRLEARQGGQSMIDGVLTVAMFSAIDELDVALHALRTTDDVRNIVGVHGVIMKPGQGSVFRRYPELARAWSESLN